jgi:hypothetical protein
MICGHAYQCPRPANYIYEEDDDFYRHACCSTCARECNVETELTLISYYFPYDDTYLEE